MEEDMNMVELSCDFININGNSDIKLNGERLKYVRDIRVKATYKEATEVTVTLLARVNFNQKQD